MDSYLIRQKQIIDFRNSFEVKALEAYYSKPCIFSALGESRRESTHSNFLAWLLTPKPERNDHGLGDLPLRKFLETLVLACQLPHSAGAGKMAPDLINAVTSGAYKLSDIVVSRETVLDDNRFDVFIKGHIEFDGSKRPFFVLIENKVKSSEHNSQTERYYEALRRAVSPSAVLLSIFLTPSLNSLYESRITPSCECKEFIELNYQYLADYVIVPCRDSLPEGSIKRYLDEYLLALSLPETNQNKGDVKMAVTYEERELLSQFWDKHKDLLTSALSAIGECVPLSDEEAKIMEEASEVIRNAGVRDTGKYSWVFKERGRGDNLSKRQLVQEVVAFYSNVNKGITVRDLCEKFPNAVKPIDIANEKSHECYNFNSPVTCSDGQAVVYNQWRLNNINAFIASAESLGFVITRLVN